MTEHSGETKYSCKYCDKNFKNKEDLEHHIDTSRKCACIRDSLFICRKCYHSTDTLSSLYSHFEKCESSSVDENIFERINDIVSEKNEKIEELTTLSLMQHKTIEKLRVRLKIEREKSKIFRSTIENIGVKLPDKICSKNNTPERTSPENKKQQKKEFKFEDEYEEEYEEEMEEDDISPMEVCTIPQEIFHIIEDTDINIESDDDDSSSMTSDDENFPCANNEPVLTNEYIDKNKEKLEGDVCDIRSCISYADNITWVASCVQLRQNVSQERSQDFSQSIDAINENRNKRRKLVCDDVLRQTTNLSSDITELRFDFSQSVDIYDNEASVLSCNQNTHFEKVCVVVRKLRDKRLRVFLQTGVKEYLAAIREDIGLFVKKIESIENQTKNENYVLVARNINSFLSNFDQYMIASSVQRNRNTDIQQSNFNRCDCFVKIKQSEKGSLFNKIIPSPKPDNTLCKKVRNALWYDFRSNLSAYKKFRTFKRNNFLDIFRNAIVGVKHIHEILSCYFRAMRFYPCVAYVRVSKQSHPHAFFVLEKIGQDGKRFWRHDFMLDDICSSVSSEINTILSEILTEFMTVFNSRAQDGTYTTADLRLIYQTILNNIFYTIDMKFFGPILRKCVVKECGYVFTQNDFIINLNLRQTMSTFSFRPTASNLVDEFRSTLMKIFMEECITYRHTTSFVTDEQKREIEIHEAKISEKWELIEEISLSNVEKFLYCFPNFLQHIRDNFTIEPDVFAKMIDTGASSMLRRNEEIDEIEISENARSKISNRLAAEYLEKLRHLETSLSRSVSNIDTLIEIMEKKNERNFLRHTLTLYADYLNESK